MRAMDQRIAIAQLNADYFRELLASETEAVHRQKLQRLLTREEATLAALRNLPETGSA
jgi:hypothetical protein